jgi:hypothetical protein
MMPHAKLRRCDCCKKFHASYVVPDPESGAKAYYCYDCWKALFASEPPPEPIQEAQVGNDQADSDPPAAANPQ